MSAYETSARHAAVEVVRGLRAGGHVAYFAGGCVRDRLLGKWPADYDVATDAKPDRVRELFRRSRFVGEAFGVVLVSAVGDMRPAEWGGPQRPVRKDGRWVHQVEVATFRTEWGYADGRRPTGIAFSDAEHDARRRDFTINGLFEDPLAEAEDERIIDFVGGRRDLATRVLRAIGAADERFGEDFLRLLRAVRFAARLDFRLERETAAAVRRHAASLSRISRERIGQEMEAMLTGPRPLRCVRLLQRLGLDGPVLEETSRRPALTTVAAAARLRRKEEMDYSTMLSAWLLDRHLPRGASMPAAVAALMPALAEVLNRWRRALCLPNEQRDAMRHALMAFAEAMDWPALGVARRKRLLARSGWRGAWVLLRSAAQGPADVERVATIAHEAASLFAEGVAPEPLVTGDDLVAAGVAPGPGLGRLLESIYDAQLEHRISTRQQAMQMAQADTTD